jgi:hypothetical protein
MSSSMVNDKDNYNHNNSTFFTNITKNILNSNKSIRWVGIIDQNDILL